MTHDIGFLERLGEAVEETARSEAKRAAGSLSRIVRLRTMLAGRSTWRWLAACTAAIVVTSGGIALAGVPLGWYASSGTKVVGISDAKLFLGALRKGRFDPAMGGLVDPQLGRPALAPVYRFIAPVSLATRVEHLTLDLTGTAWIVGEDPKNKPFIAYLQDDVWHRLPAPPGRHLPAIAAIGTSDVWASTGGRNLSHWDGLRWTRWTPPAGARGRVRLALDLGSITSFVVVSPHDIWGVAHRPRSYHDVAGRTWLGNTTVSVHWDGKTWTKVTVPRLPGRSAFLGALSAAGKEVWAAGSLQRAVGIHHSGTEAVSIIKDEPVVLRLGQGSWQRVRFPQMGAGGTDLQDVTVIGPRDVWVLGVARLASEFKPQRSRAFLMHWDGRAWHEVTGPFSDPGPYWPLVGMRAIGDRDVWITGSTPPAQTQMLHWDGVSWSSSTPPGPSALGKGEMGTGMPLMVAGAADNIWASAALTILPDDPLLWRWDGHQWSKIQVAIP